MALRSGAPEQRSVHWHQSENRPETDSIENIFSKCPFFYQRDSSLHSLFPPLGALADAEFDVEIEEESSTDYYFCLVQESVINPPIETETQLTSHKTVRTAATFKTSKIDFCKSIFEGRIFKKRIL